MSVPSRTQIDRLGEHLRLGAPSESDLLMLDDYRRSFGVSYQPVVQTIRSELSLEPTGRPAKSTGAIVEKLQRESIRLVQMQDIAGCRVVVTDCEAQEQVVDALRRTFASATVIDRRTKPSFGYRAVHMVVDVYEKPVEIQIRTYLQDQWAELLEKVAQGDARERLEGDLVELEKLSKSGRQDVADLMRRFVLELGRGEGGKP
jgi:putative GTP pyrophosphokinase